MAAPPPSGGGNAPDDSGNSNGNGSGNGNGNGNDNGPGKTDAEKIALNALSSLMTVLPPTTVQEVRDALASDDNKTWLERACIQSSLRDSQIQQIAELATSMGSKARIVDALLYLECNRWNLGAAWQQWWHDEQARGPGVVSRRTQVDWNRFIDRLPVLSSDPTNPLKQTVSVKKDNKWTEHHYAREGTPEKEQDEQEAATAKKNLELLRINRWRNRVLRRVPLYPPRKSGKKGAQNQAEWYGELEKRYIENLYLKTTDGSPNFKLLAENLNKAFHDVYRPGDVRLAPPRRDAQISSWLDRTWMKEAKRNQPRIRARLVKIQIRAKHAQDLADLEELLDQGVSSTIADARAVENEKEPVIEDDGFPLTEEDLKTFGADEEEEKEKEADKIVKKAVKKAVGPPLKKLKLTPVTKTPVAKPQGSSIHIGRYYIYLPNDFHLGRERDPVTDEPVGEFFRSESLLDEIEYERANLGNLATADPMTREQWRRAGGVVMAYYFTHQTQQDNININDFLNYLGVPVNLRAGTAGMDDILSWFDNKARSYEDDDEDDDEYAD